MILDKWSLGRLLFYDVSINWLNLNKGFARWAKIQNRVKYAAFKAHALDDCKTFSEASSGRKDVYLV